MKRMLFLFLIAGLFIVFGLSYVSAHNENDVSNYLNSDMSSIIPDFLDNGFVSYKIFSSYGDNSSSSEGIKNMMIFDSLNKNLY